MTKTFISFINEANDDFDADDDSVEVFDFDSDDFEGDEFDTEDDDDFEGDEFDTEDDDDDFEGDEFDTEDDDDDDTTNPDRMGLIRIIANAHLVYKRENDAGTFDEMWIYNTDNAAFDELEVRRDILAGTDIEPRATASKDGLQSYELYTVGNAQILSITGLPQ